jgi:hypothetical protein
MNIQKLYEEILKIKTSNSNSFNAIVSNDCYYGIDKDKNIVFISKSINKNVRSMAQQTKQLYLGRNISCTVNSSKGIERNIFDIIICFDKNPAHIIMFLHLTQVYVEVSKTKDSNITSFFDSLKSLFANKQQLSLSELQGLYGELYFINFMNKLGINVGIYWQSQDKMKFDFSIDAIKKIEVKTTTNEMRKHKFRHEQLVSDIYDIWIVSFLLSNDDHGLSLYELAEMVMHNNPSNLQLHTRITKLLNNYSTTELQSIRFNEQYTNTHIRFYNTKNVPRFLERQPDGVSNTEYDSDLSTVQAHPIDELITWLKSNE